MKPYLCLLLLVAFNCGACELSDIEGLRKDLESAFSSKSFLGIGQKYGDSQRIHVTVENEYDDESPTTILEFESVAELSAWFLEMHEHSEHMFIPSPVHCRDGGCTYDRPELTLHHGIYLLGFEARKTGSCLSVTHLHIYWG